MRMTTVAVTLFGLIKVRTRVARLVVRNVRLAVATLAEPELGFQVHHVGLGRLNQSSDTVEDQLSQALGVAVAHLPRSMVILASRKFDFRS